MKSYSRALIVFVLLFTPSELPFTSPVSKFRKAMLSFLCVSILSSLLVREISSVQLVKIRYASIQSFAFVRPSGDVNCTDCLCDCFQSGSILSILSTCQGVNCFPSQSACQYLDHRPWVYESDVFMDTNSTNFALLKPNGPRLCSCYTPAKILNAYAQANASTIDQGRVIKYIASDDTLIVADSTSVRKVSAKNRSLVLRSLSNTEDTSAGNIIIVQSTSAIYIAFGNNRSVNLFDSNLRLRRASVSWINQTDVLLDVALSNNRLFILDQSAMIWSIDLLNETNPTHFYNTSSSNISAPSNVFIYRTDWLYIFNRTATIFVFELSTMALNRTIPLPVTTSISTLRYDANCNRVWIAGENSSSISVLDLATDRMATYPSPGSMGQSGVYSMDFDMNYTLFFTGGDKNVCRISPPVIQC